MHDATCNMRTRETTPNQTHIGVSNTRSAHANLAHTQSIELMRQGTCAPRSSEQKCVTRTEGSAHWCPLKYGILGSASVQSTSV